MIISFEDVPYEDKYSSWYHLSGLVNISVTRRECVYYDDVGSGRDGHHEVVPLPLSPPHTNKTHKGPHPIPSPSKSSNTSCNSNGKGKARQTSTPIVTQFMMFARPGHPFLLRALENIVEMVKQEFYCNSVFNSSLINVTYPMMRLFVITGPWALTATIRQLVRENETNLDLVRVVSGYQFKEHSVWHLSKRSYFRMMKVKAQNLLSVYYKSDKCVW